MAIDLTEQLIPLVQVPEQPFIPLRRAGKKLNAATVFRWASRGARGVRLEAIRCGGTLCTTKGALLDFFRALTPGQQFDQQPRLRTLNSRELAADRAGRKLSQAGV